MLKQITILLYKLQPCQLMFILIVLCYFINLIIYLSSLWWSFTLIVSSGCPANKRQIPPTPPATKFFRGETFLSDSTASIITTILLNIQFNPQLPLSCLCALFFDHLLWMDFHHYFPKPTEHHSTFYNCLL